jgi:hypothetical protein
MTARGEVLGMTAGGEVLGMTAGGEVLAMTTARTIGKEDELLATTHEIAKVH